MSDIDVGQISEALNNKVDLDCDNINTDGEKHFDGQWVSFERIMFAENVTAPTSTDIKYDLSSYLPNDNYKYEAMFSVRAVTGTTSGNGVDIQLYTSEQPTISTVIVYTRTASAMMSGCQVIMPIGTDRSLSVLANTGNKGTYYLWLEGYRRIGVNQ